MSLAEIDKRIQGLYEQWSSLQPLSRENDERLWVYRVNQLCTSATIRIAL